MELDEQRGAEVGMELVAAVHGARSDAELQRGQLAGR
jgi:hypothetical protein